MLLQGSRQALLRRGSQLVLRKLSSSPSCLPSFASQHSRLLLSSAFGVGTACYYGMREVEVVHCDAVSYAPALTYSPPKSKEATTWLRVVQQQARYGWHLFTRWLYLFCTYSPALVYSPVLVIGSEDQVKEWWELFKGCILASGPCSIKFAQWISTRPDLFPKELCQQFQHLQSNKAVPPWSAIEPVLRREYGENWSKLLNLVYDKESKEPVVIGGGCVAQVLHGRVKVFSDPNDPNSPPLEKDVAIKITHPGVKDSIVADIELMRTISSTLEYWIPSIKQVSLCDSVEEFAKIMIEQVDMVFEAKALATFRQHFSTMDSSTKFMTMIMRQSTGYDVIFPEPIFEYTTEDVLVEEFADGVLIRDYIKTCSAKEKKAIAKIGLDAIFKMIFLDNFIHAGKLFRNVNANLN